MPDSLRAACGCAIRWRCCGPTSARDSPAARHAVRLAVLVPLTDIFIRSFGVQRGYWVALTILVVLRPDFAQTFQRSLMRVLGTLIGSGARQPDRALRPARLDPGHDRAAGSVVLRYADGRSHQHGAVLDLPGRAGRGAAVTVRCCRPTPQWWCGWSTPRSAARSRLLASLLWPSWERQQLPERMAELIGGLPELPAIDGRSGHHPGRRAAARRQARLARSSAEASLDRARAEPVNSRGRIELASIAAGPQPSAGARADRPGRDPAGSRDLHQGARVPDADRCGAPARWPPSSRRSPSAGVRSAISSCGRCRPSWSTRWPRPSLAPEVVAGGDRRDRSAGEQRRFDGRGAGRAGTPVAEPGLERGRRRTPRYMLADRQLNLAR